MIRITRELYTDGSCYPNPGPGGWAVVDAKGDLVKDGENEFTTNIQMEAMAILAAMNWAHEHPKVKVVINTDSEFWVKTISGEYDGEKNRELKFNLRYWAEVLKDRVEIKWVRGHNGLYGNERADHFALKARERAIKTRNAAKKAAARG